MTWALVASFAVTAISSIVGGSSKKKAAYKQRTADLQQEQAAWDRNSAENRALDQANLTNTIRTGYKAGLLNLQEAQARRNGIENGTNLTKSGMAAISSNAANAAAAGTIGPSVDAVVNDIHMKVDEARSNMADDYDQEMDNFDTQLYDLLTAGQDAMRSSVKYIGTAAREADTSGTGVGAALAGAAVQTAGTYFSQRMSLGLGSKAPAAPTTTPPPPRPGS